MHHRDQDFSLPQYLDGLVRRFETEAFIQEDPISIPHGFDDAGDVEVIGLFAALLAWGRRSTMLAKLEELCDRMRYRPAAFVRELSASAQAERLRGFKHRTFQTEDAVHLTLALRALLHEYGSLQHAFSRFITEQDRNVEPAIQGFSQSVMAAVPGMPARMQKHLARPSTGSACKRLAMYLRWLVRPGPVDFGMWDEIRVDQLVLPLDVHTGRQARMLGMIERRQDDWRTVCQLTARCRTFDPSDPARYDFALFGAGAYAVEHPPHLLGHQNTG